MSEISRSGHAVNLTIVDSTLLFVSRNWILLFACIFGIYVFLPFFAPLFMVIGWDGMGKAIYTMYSFLCHQLPERSYFLFGPKVSYSIPEIQVVWKDTLNPVILRQFLGSTEMGWKVAWSDRMVSMYVSTWLFGLIWWPLRKRLKPLPWWGLVLFLTPMAVDGTSHLISDLSGLGQGFRDSNTWLAELTGNVFPATFYAGDAWGSFNAWLRLLTGIFFGIGIVWFGFPFISRAFEETNESIREKAERLATWKTKQDELYRTLIRIAEESNDS